MSTSRVLTVLTLTTILACSTLAEGPTTAPAGEQPATKTATTAPAVQTIPYETLAKLSSLLVQPASDRMLSRAEAIKTVSQRMDEVLTLGSQLEKDYPDAPDLYNVRMGMLKAAHFLAMANPGDAAARRLYAIADRVISSDAPLMEKFQADLIKTFSTVTLEAPGVKVDRPDAIRQFVKRYEATDAAAMAAVYGHSMAMRLIEAELAEELRKVLVGKHNTSPAAARYLNALAKSAVGKPFSASLTRMNGETLSLPDDLVGKVVVIDFWATWCVPCLAAMPEKRAIYAKYKDQGLEIVGISIDSDRAALEKYLSTEKLPWIQTYSGKGRQDPTAVKYGVNTTPTVWVVGRDGKVVSDEAFRQMEAVIVRALRLPAPDDEKN